MIVSKSAFAGNYKFVNNGPPRIRVKRTIAIGQQVDILHMPVSSSELTIGCGVDDSLTVCDDDGGSEGSSGTYS